jgi:hypothetical protein
LPEPREIDLPEIQFEQVSNLVEVQSDAYQNAVTIDKLRLC